MNTRCFRPWRPALQLVCGFTLLEVTLAIVITVGMLVVILFFYRQAADLRQGLIEETERIAAARLVLNRLTLELRSARPHDSLLISLTGASNAIEFVRTTLPSPASWARDDLGRARQPENDLRLVRYELGVAGDAAGVAGLTRSEGPVPELDPLFPGDESLEPAEPDLFFQSDTPVPELLTSQLRYLRFRYWNGADWEDSWNRQDLPVGVEVNLGVEPAPPPDELGEEESDLEYPFEVFRRIICLPGGRPVAKTNVFLQTLGNPTAPEEVP